MYSTQNAIDRAFKNKERKLILQSKAQHPDIKNIHPDFTRDASQGQYTLIKKHIKDLKDKHLKKLSERHNKLGERV